MCWACCNNGGVYARRAHRKATTNAAPKKKHHRFPGVSPPPQRPAPRAQRVVNSPNVRRGPPVAPLPWFLLSWACVVHSVAIYIPIYLGTRPARGEKGHGGPAQKEMRKTFSFWAESVLHRLGIFFSVVRVARRKTEFFFPLCRSSFADTGHGLGPCQARPPRLRTNNNAARVFHQGVGEKLS